MLIVANSFGRDWKIIVQTVYLKLDHSFPRDSGQWSTKYYSLKLEFITIKVLGVTADPWEMHV